MKRNGEIKNTNISRVRLTMCGCHDATLSDSSASFFCLLVCQLSGPPDSADSHLLCLCSRAHLALVSSSPQPYDCTATLAFRLCQVGSLHMELFSFCDSQSTSDLIGCDLPVFSLYWGRCFWFTGV